MMNDVRNKNINVNSCFKLDGLTRSVYNIEKLMKVVKEKEIEQQVMAFLLDLIKTDMMINEYYTSFIKS